MVISLDPYVIIKDMLNLLKRKKKMPIKRFEKYLKARVKAKVRINISEDSLNDYIWNLENEGKIRIWISDTGQKYVIFEGDNF